MSQGEWHSVWVNGGRPALAAASDRQSLNGDHLGEAVYTHEDEWSGAQPLLGDSPVQEGALVSVTGRPGWGRVSRVRRLDSGHTVDVDIGGVIENYEATALTVLDADLRDPEFWIDRGATPARDVARTLSWTKLNYPLNDTLYSYAATKTTFKPYQFIPVLKMLNSETGRILVADEVGLGKTIEAGLIWTELEQRQHIRRALVVVPASLRVKWMQEMERRFMRPLRSLSIGDLATFICDMRDGKDADLVGVISLESVRAAVDVLTEFAEVAPPLDLLIIDEAHALRNAGTRSHEVGTVLAPLADHVVFLSATPLNLGQDDLFNLVHLLDQGNFPDKSVFMSQLEPNAHLNAVARNIADPRVRLKAKALVDLAEIEKTEYGQALAARPTFERLRALLESEKPLTRDDVARVKRYSQDLNTLGSVVSRTRKIDVPGDKAVREAEAIEVQWTNEERALYDAIHSLAFGRAKKARVPLGFAMQMPLRQACSSLIVAQRKIAARDGLELLDADAVEAEQALATGNGSDDPVTQSDRGAKEVFEALSLRTAISHDSKLSALRARLELARANGMTQALVFSFFRGTVEYLATELDDRFRTGVLHGGVPMEDRQEILDRFRNNEIDILIANQVGSEGLDFEFCNVLVNYDLPWNPMQVEQRIGRLDRFGQLADKIHIFNMYTPDTIESEIFGRLYERIGVFERSIGDLEPILRGGFPELNAKILDPNLSPEQKMIEIDRFEVAVVQERDRASALEEQSGMLTSLALLDVEGLTESGPTNGRYVGAAELRELLVTVLNATGGKLEKTADPDVFTVTGSTTLSTKLAAYRHDKSGTTHGIARILGSLRDGLPITVTFNPNHLLAARTELITARHPLIRFAVDHLASHEDELARFAEVSVRGLPAGRTFVASVDLIRTAGGLKTGQELWVTAVDVQTGAVSEDVSDALMTALAEGTWAETETATPIHLVRAAHDRATSEAASRRRREQSERQQENAALIAARVASEKKSLRVQVERASETLARVKASGRNESISRMHAGRIRNLTAQLDEVDAKYASRQQLAMSVQKVAVLTVTGR